MILNLLGSETPLKFRQQLSALFQKDVHTHKYKVYIEFHRVPDAEGKALSWHTFTSQLPKPNNAPLQVQWSGGHTWSQHSSVSTDNPGCWGGELLCLHIYSNHKLSLQPYTRLSFWWTTWSGNADAFLLPMCREQSLGGAFWEEACVTRGCCCCPLYCQVPLAWSGENPFPVQGPRWKQN